MTDLISSSDAAAKYGYKNADTMGNALRRWGLRPAHRATGQGGENMWDAAEVQRAIDNRPRPPRPDLRSTTD